MLKILKEKKNWKFQSSYMFTLGWQGTLIHILFKDSLIKTSMSLVEMSLVAVVGKRHMENHILVQSFLFLNNTHFYFSFYRPKQAYDHLKRAKKPNCTLCPAGGKTEILVMTMNNYPLDLMACTNKHMADVFERNVINILKNVYLCVVYMHVYIYVCMCLYHTL